MLRLSDFQYLMDRLGPVMPEIAAIVQQDVDQWLIIFDENTCLQLSFQSEPLSVYWLAGIRQSGSDQGLPLINKFVPSNLSIEALAFHIKDCLRQSIKYPASRVRSVEAGDSL